MGLYYKAGGGTCDIEYRDQMQWFANDLHSHPGNFGNFLMDIIIIFYTLEQ